MLIYLDIRLRCVKRWGMICVAYAYDVNLTKTAVQANKTRFNFIENQSIKNNPMT